MNSNQLSLSIYGGTGFIGSRFCKLSKQKCILSGREIRNPLSDNIVYFISTTHNYHVFDDLKRDINTNLIVLMEVLDAIKEKNNIVVNFISSWFVYGETSLPAHENDCCQPKGFYSITKHAAEELLISFCKTYGIKYRILRLSNVYGLGDNSISKKKNALQYLISEMKKNNPISLYHGGDFYRDYMHIDDICRAIDLCVERGPLNEIINIGTGNKVKFRDVIEIAKKELNSDSKITAINPPQFHKVIQVKDFYMDVSKLEKLGFNPKINIEEGIKDICHH